MKQLLTLALLMGLVLTGMEALANTDSPQVDHRQQRQDHRIEQGVQSGELTRREANRLDRNQNRINAMEANFKSDGQLTRRERARLHRNQNVQNRKIHRQKHDRQDRY